jgi:hypothetical protein
MVQFTVLSQFQLGANPIGTSHQDWFAHAGGQAAEAAKTAQPPQYLWPAGGFNAAADPINKGPASFHINASAAVIQSKPRFIGHADLPKSKNHARICQTHLRLAQASISAAYGADRIF